MATLNKKQVLEQTDGGLKLFQLLIPDLEMSEGRNISNVDSPLSKGNKCFSVYQHSPLLYYFKDHFSKHYGDIFEFIACLHGLSSKYDFKRVLEIIGDILVNAYYHVPEDQLEEYNNSRNETSLVIVKSNYSELYLGRHFRKALKYLDKMPSYEMHVVKSFSAIAPTGERVNYKFEYSKPDFTYYAVSIQKGKYYILFNPVKRRCIEWGSAPEFYVLGMENLFRVAHCENIYLRETLVLTNCIHGLLYLQDKGIPSIALINGEEYLPDYFEKIIAPLFPNKHLLLDLSPNVMGQMKAFNSVYGYKNIRSKESYLDSLFNKKDGLDYILGHFEFNEEFEYIGYEDQIKKITK